MNLWFSEYLLRLNTESQFSFPLVRMRIVQDSSLHIGSNILAYLFIFNNTRWSVSFMYFSI